MASPVNPAWPSGRAMSVHWIQVRKAFEPGSGAFPARLVGVHDGDVLVQPVRGGDPRSFVVARPARLESVLTRDDMTLLNDAPLVLVGERYGVLGIATGPPDPPRQLAVTFGVTRLEDGETVEMPGSGGQPSFQLLRRALGLAGAVRDLSHQEENEQSLAWAELRYRSGRFFGVVILDVEDPDEDAAGADQVILETEFERVERSTWDYRG